jgi:hypothetical protein
MQFYTKLRYAKIIIFFPRCIYLQCMFPGYFSNAIHIQPVRDNIIFYNHHSRERLCTLYEFWSKRFLCHLAHKSKSIALRDSTLAHSSQLSFFHCAVNLFA